MKRTLLLVGGREIRRGKLAPSYRGFIRYARKLKKKGKFDLKVTNYKSVVNKDLPQINTKNITIMLFFPFEYWNKNIEVYKKDTRIYGDSKFGRGYTKFFKEVKKNLREGYRKKNIRYINSPGSCILDRDKKKTKELLLKNNIPTPRMFSTKRLKDIDILLGKGKSIYIKPRFGAMGKGITYVSREGVLTNFLYRQDRIISRPYDYNWRFSRVSRQRGFLSKLLGKDVICEEAIEPTVHDGRRFDFRIYVIYGKVPYFYAKSVPGDSLVTNWSQGGKIEKKREFIRYIPKTKVDLMITLAKKTASLLGLNYTGVDILFSKGFKQPYVLEAHAFPAYEKGFDLMKFLSKKV